MNGAFQTTVQAVTTLILMGGIGFVIVRRRLISEEGVRALSALVIDVCLPLLMFVEIARRFDPKAYPDWWMFPFLSVVITLAGYLLGRLVLGLDPKIKPWRQEFLGLTTFQNSGYLPIPLIASLLPGAAGGEMFIYLFLFLLGFNMTIFSFGVTLLCTKDACRGLELRRMINPPTLGVMLGLAVAWMGVTRFIPETVLNPMELIGRCTIPLSMVVVGGNLALLKTRGFVARPLVWGLLVKMIVFPLAVLGVLMVLKPRPMVGWLLVVQAAMPPAALLSVISKNIDAEDRVTSQGIFYGHLVAIVTIPLMLYLFRTVFGDLGAPLAVASGGW